MKTHAGSLGSQSFPCHFPLKGPATLPGDLSPRCESQGHFLHGSKEQEEDSPPLGHAVISTAPARRETQSQVWQVPWWHV